MLHGEAIGPHLLVPDAPDHTPPPKLVARKFTMRRVERFAPRVRQVTDGLLDAMLHAGRGELVDGATFPLPITVVCEPVGVPPADRDTFRAWSGEIVAPPGAQALADAVSWSSVYLDHLIEKKHCSGRTDDLHPPLLRTRTEDGDRLSAAELCARACPLLSEPHETTRPADH